MKSTNNSVNAPLLQNYSSHYQQEGSFNFDDLGANDNKNVLTKSVNNYILDCQIREKFRE